MNDQNLPPKSPPPPGGIPKIVWLAVAFAPSVATLLIIKFIKFFDYHMLSDLLICILLMVVICSCLAAWQLASGIKRRLERNLWFLFLTIFFVIANILLSSFLGCSAKL